MKLRLATVGLGAAWEAALVQACRWQHARAEVAQRCYDLADLLGASAAGRAQVAIVADGIRWLDQDALGALARAGTGVVAVASPEDPDAERRLRRLGIVHVASTSDTPERLLTLAEAAAVMGDAGGLVTADGPFAGVGQPAEEGDAADFQAPEVGSREGASRAGPAADSGRDDAPGQLVVVWGPKGAPGRTTVAVNLAVEAARAGADTILVDADTYGGSVAQILGLLDDATNLAWAARLAARGQLDADRLRHEIPRTTKDGPYVLVGLPRAELWTELRPAVWEHLLDQIRRAFGLAILDVGFCLEEDEELLYDQVRFRRNAVACDAVQKADAVIAVTRADPAGLHDFIRGFQALRGLGVSTDRVRVVVNQFRPGPFGADPASQIRAALSSYLGVEPAAFVPYDRGAVDASISVVRALAEACPTSPASRALADLTRSMLGMPAPTARRRRRRAAEPTHGPSLVLPRAVVDR